jgi:D-amino-acid oxidase
VIARDLPAETTSAALGGLWLPALAHLAAESPSLPAATVTRWARTTLVELLAIAEDPKTATGVRLAAGHLLHTRPVPPPQWAASVPELVSLRAEADPAPGYPFGYRVSLPVVNTPTYLAYLQQRLTGSGGTLTRLPLPALPPRGLVINCTGLAARALVPDPSVQPEREQVVLMSDPGLDQWWCDTESDDRSMYVLPRGRDVVVGGTVEAGRWDTTADPRIAERLVEQARAAVPRLSSAQVLGHRVGLRPARPSIRLEVERRPNDDDPDHTVVHCYGHGGSGLTLSWGCAEDVAAAVTSLAPG